MSLLKEELQITLIREGQETKGTKENSRMKTITKDSIGDKTEDMENLS